MKNLFVTRKIEKYEKKESKLLIGKCKPEEKKDKLDLSLSPMNSESTKFSQSPKSNSHDMPIISRKETLNALSTDNSFSFDLKNASSFDDKNIKQKSFLGKKSKIHFNVIKENSENNIDNPIKNNLENDLNQIYFEKGTKTKPKIRFYKKNIEKLENVKIGRWTFQERIKFIKALIENGKKWKLIQKQIGTRTCTQTRSHAQKFIIKLKSIENDEFDFNKNSIKNLNDIIEEIRKKYIMKNSCEVDEKKFIISTLLKLSENTSIEKIENELKDKNEENHEIDDNKKNQNIEKLETNNINPEKNIGHNNSNLKINEENNNILEKDDKDNKEDKKEEDFYLNDIYNSTNSINNLDNYSQYCESDNQKLVFDGDFHFYLDNNSLLDLNNDYYFKEHNYMKNIEKSEFINRNFFS